VLLTHWRAVTLVVPVLVMAAAGRALLAAALPRLKRTRG
jgi:hypothetical protein